MWQHRTLTHAHACTHTHIRTHTDIHTHICTPAGSIPDMRVVRGAPDPPTPRHPGPASTTRPCFKKEKEKPRPCFNHQAQLQKNKIPGPASTFEPPSNITTNTTTTRPRAGCTPVARVARRAPSPPRKRGAAGGAGAGAGRAEGRAHRQMG